MNILYLSERDPRDTFFGGAQRTNFIWRALQQCGEVYSIFFDQQYESEEIAPRIWHGKKLLKVNAWHYFWYRLERKILKPFNVLPLWPVPTVLEKSIEEMFPDVKFDVVVCRYCFDMAEMHLWNFPKVYVDFDDHPIEMYKSLKGQEVQPWLRPLGRLIIKGQMKYLSRKISGGWVSNPEQASMIRSKQPIVGLKNIAVTPSASYNPNAQRINNLMIVGSLSYYPNYTGIDKFLAEIWPSVHAHYPDLTLSIIGQYIQYMPKDYYDRWQKIPNVIVKGYVENLEKEYESCLAAIVPIYSGGGTCIKTREAMAYSRVCLSSPFGARGLDECLNTGIGGLCVYHSSDEFLSLMDCVVMNEPVRRKSESDGRNYIAKTHSAEAFMKTVVDTILH